MGPQALHDALVMVAQMEQWATQTFQESWFMSSYAFWSQWKVFRYDGDIL